CQEMEDCEVEERPGGHRLVRHLFPVSKSLDVRPVFLVSRSFRSRGHHVDGAIEVLGHEGVDVIVVRSRHRTVGASDPDGRQGLTGSWALHIFRTERGLLGDRSYALLDPSTGMVVSAKNPRKWARMF